MQQVDDRPLETIHVYVSREEIKPAPSQLPLILPLVFSLLALFGIVALGTISPYLVPQVRETLRVPAILLPLRTFTTTVQVTATGIKTYLATTAHGLLTLTNGSILSEALPAGMIFAGSAGQEVVTDSAVVVPAGGVSGYGYATVSAHAALPGRQGNIAALAINQVLGTAVYVRNIAAFTGGRNAYTVHYITHRDREDALATAREQLTASVYAGILAYPCRETVTLGGVARVRWACQFVTYHVPGYMRVVGVKVRGNYFYLDVVFVAHQNKFYSK